MKELYLILIILLLSNSLWGQDLRYRDSITHYNDIGQYERAKFFAEIQLDKAKKANVSNFEICEAFNDLGTTLYNLNKYEQSLECYFNAEKILREMPLKTDTCIQYATILMNIGNVYISMHRLQDADSLSLKALNIFTSQSKEDGDLIDLLNNLGYINALRSDYITAKKFYSTAIAKEEKIEGINNSRYALLLNNLGDMYINLADYSLAETYLKKSLQIREALPNKNLLDIAFSLSNLAVVYKRNGNKELAIKYNIEAIKIRENELGRSNPTYATSINNLAMIYKEEREYKMADSLFQIATEIFKTTLGEKHPVYASMLNNLAQNYGQMGNLEKASYFFQKALNVYLSTNNEVALGYAAILKDYARCLYFSKKYKDADTIILKAQKIYKGKLHGTHPDFIRALANMADISYAKKDFQNGEVKVLELISLQTKSIENKLSFLSEKELYNYLAENESILQTVYLKEKLNYSHNLAKTSYNTQLFLKNISLHNTSSLSKQMENTQDSVLQKTWYSYKLTKSLYNKQLSLPITKRNFNTDSLAEVANTQEKELLRQSAAYRDMKTKLSTTWEDVKNHLKNNEAAIEFVKFNALRKDFIEQDTTFYAAMLVRAKDTCPVFINLFEERELQVALKKFAYKANILNNKDSVYNNTKTNKNIYSLLWQPILPYLKNINTIYYAPDGLLHQIAFAAIPYKKDSLLCDKYNLVQVSSTRQVVENQFKQISFSSAALFGGINYNNQITDSSPSKPDAFAYVYQQNRSASLDSFNYLPNTLKEISSIKQYSEKYQINVTLFNKEKATEAAFRNLSGNQSPNIIHFATHGFTLANAQKQTSLDNNTNSFKLSDNPLMRCGLVLAGGNKGWKGKTTIDEDDGILTGLEISNTNLANTELVVLSACETGLGQLAGSEGVFGLQRAFKLAGVNYIMASLWQVPDKETSEFMQTFYSFLFKEQNIRTAFIKTQKQMHKKYPPYYWAGFTLVQ